MRWRNDKWLCLLREIISGRGWKNWKLSKNFSCFFMECEVGVLFFSFLFWRLLGKGLLLKKNYWFFLNFINYYEILILNYVKECIGCFLRLWSNKEL